MKELVFTITIEVDDSLTKEQIQETIEEQLDDFGNGEYWDRGTDSSLIGDIVVE